MATLSQTLTARATAGARYAAAVTELRAALVDLAALDRVLDNRNSGLPAASRPVLTFSGTPDSIPPGLLHPVYSASAGGNIEDAIAAQTKTYLAAFT